jgi:hypothetical protein
MVSDASSSADYLVWATRGSPARELLTHFWQPIALANEVNAGTGAARLQLFGSRFVLSCDGRGDYRLAAADSEEATPRTYPCQDRNGLVFAFLGENDIPSLPDFDCYMAPEDHAAARAGTSGRSWREALEAELYRSSKGSPGWQCALKTVERTPYGMRIIARLDRGGTQQCVRVSNLMFPNAVVEPAGDDLVRVAWFVPIDDRTHRWFAIWYKFAERIGARESTGAIHAFSPSLAAPDRSDAVTKTLRLLLLDGMIEATGEQTPLFHVDGMTRAVFRGPVAIEALFPANEIPPWGDADLSRRSRSSWARFSEKNWRWS